MTKPKQSVKKSDKPSGKASGRKKRREGVPQPHGGMLVPGAGGGPQPNSGRPPSAIRATLREAFDRRIPMLEKIADDENASPGDRMKAAELLAKYGLGTTVTETDADGNNPPPKSISVALVRPNFPENLPATSRILPETTEETK